MHRTGGLRPAKNPLNARCMLHAIEHCTHSRHYCRLVLEWLSRGSLVSFSCGFFCRVPSVFFGRTAGYMVHMHRPRSSIAECLPEGWPRVDRRRQQKMIKPLPVTYLTESPAVVYAGPACVTKLTQTLAKRPHMVACVIKCNTLLPDIQRSFGLVWICIICREM